MSEQNSDQNNTHTVQAQEAPAQAETPAHAYSPEYVRGIRQESANYRVQLRESETARQKLEEQVSALTAEKARAESASQSAQADLDRVVTAIQARVPHDHVFAFAKTLQGSNAEELASHAAELTSMFGFSASHSAATDRSQGLGTGPASADPAAEFAALVNSKLTR